jgi:hypothetical protein
MRGRDSVGQTSKEHAQDVCTHEQTMNAARDNAADEHVSKQRDEKLGTDAPALSSQCAARLGTAHSSLSLHTVPFPTQPALHWHVKLPTVSTHRAPGSQSLAPEVHSLSLTHARSVEFHAYPRVSHEQVNDLDSGQWMQRGNQRCRVRWSVKRARLAH